MLKRLTLLALALVWLLPVRAQADMPLPAVPDSLRTAESRAEWLSLHFFDRLDPADPALAADPDWLARAFSTYATLMPLLTQVQADTAAVTVMRGVALRAPALYAPMADIAMQYLGERESPVYNEQGYEAFLRAIVALSATDSARRLRAEAQLQACMANRPGSTGADFALKLRSGESTTLAREVAGDAPVLMLFHDPQCEDCAALISRMRAASALSGAIEAGRLRVLCVNLGGDEQAWLDDPDHIPSAWIDAFSPDAEVMTQEIYSLPVLPSLYLLAPDMTVMLREPSLEEVLEAVK